MFTRFEPIPGEYHNVARFELSIRLLNAIKFRKMNVAREK